MSETANAPAPQAATSPSVRFGFVKFVVRDLAAMRGFYERAFGLVVAQTIDLPEIVELVLRRPGEEAGFSLILYWNRDGRETAVGSAHGPLGLYVRDVDAAYAHAVRQGAAPHREPWDADGMRVAFVLDPEGRELELISMRR
ncbi:MAG TPA: VOC family protein [Phenylobacterium sp.]|jgi:predicted enzyme related to lactoylglutathione lyase|uniref:VOC family protein n=1 Tax=Phenylobacterium sp. TaxID=1871053 RepID=UPI002BB98FCD|nr:VOC family protein [Phenylobacterium sp.]HXA39881.1 VOC family protein [Phenylobacterium sp.]